MDLWVAIRQNNAEKLVVVLRSVLKTPVERPCEAVERPWRQVFFEGETPSVSDALSQARDRNPSFKNASIRT